MGSCSCLRSRKSFQNEVVLRIMAWGPVCEVVGVSAGVRGFGGGGGDSGDGE
jgi:hypothetical protein